MKPFSSSAALTEISVPVGGKLHVRLYGDCQSSACCFESPIKNCKNSQIDNEKYGYPGNAHTTTFNEHGWISFVPALSHAGQSYDVCAKTTRITADAADFYNCVKVSVKAHRAQFISETDSSNSAPADGAVLETTVGRAFELPLPVDSLIDGGCDFTEAHCNPPLAISGSIRCPVLKKDSECICSTQDPTKCTGTCECMTECPLGPLASVGILADMSAPKNPAGLPEGATLSLATHTLQGAAVTAHTVQPWVFKWQPSHSQRNGVPSKMCFGAYMASDPSMGQETVMGEHRCYSIRVSKCRQCVQVGDTMGSIAAQHNTDWLHIYHANPSLPGFNPSHMKQGYDLRLGVLYDTRWGDDIERMAQRFLVPQSALLEQNPELTAPTGVTYTPDALGAHVQVSFVIRTRRRVLQGENITVPLDGVQGEDWEGLVSETCTAPVSTLQLLKYCSPKTHAVDDACGPGLWGLCKYDHSGVMGCRTHVCNGQGDHPYFEGGSWDRGTGSVSLVVSANIEAGHEVKVVVPQSAGLTLPRTRKAPTMVHALVPVPEMIWNPVAENYESMKICVVLPVCQSGVECLYGSDCHLKDRT